MRGVGSHGVPGGGRGIRPCRQPRGQGQEIGVARTGFADAIGAEHQGKREHLVLEGPHPGTKPAALRRPLLAEAGGGLPRPGGGHLLAEQFSRPRRIHPHQIPVTQTGQGPPARRQQQQSQGGAIGNRREGDAALPPAGARQPVLPHRRQPALLQGDGEVLGQPAPQGHQIRARRRGRSGRQTGQSGRHHLGGDLTGQGTAHITVVVGLAPMAIRHRQQGEGQAAREGEGPLQRGVLAGLAAPPMGGAPAGAHPGNQPAPQHDRLTT